MLSLLGGVHHTTLGERPFLGSFDLLAKEFANPKLAWSVFPRFLDALTDIEEAISDANRDGSRLAPYTALLPSLVPQSINI